jgi:hypothetical protein
MQEKKLAFINYGWSGRHREVIEEGGAYALQE